MNATAVRLIQEELKTLGLYGGPIDGDRGPETGEAVEKALAAQPDRLPEGWRGWSAKRKAVGFLQMLCTDEGIEAGAIDGWWGPQTDYAWEALRDTRRTGAVPPLWRDARPGDANPHGFPDQSAAALTAYYGPNGTPDGQKPPMKKVPCPWRLRIAWNQNQSRSFVWCHERAADSLGEVFERVHAHYGPAEIGRLGLDLFGGDYNPRRMRGGSAWSTHAWGIAIDWDPDRNRLKWGRDRASLAAAHYDDWWRIWEEQGWSSLGRSRNYDWMHVQAARVG